MKLTMGGIDPALGNLDKRRKRMRNQRPAWTAAGKLLERRYIRTWFKSTGSLTSPGGGPEDDTWPGLISAGYIAHKQEVGKNIKLIYDGTLRESYYARPLFSGKGLITGVRDPNRGKLKGLSNMGFNLMTLEPGMRKRIFTTISTWLETGRFK